MIRNSVVCVLFLLIAGCCPNNKAPNEPVNAYKIDYTQRHINLDYGTNPRVRFIDVGEGQILLLLHGHQSRLEELVGIIPELSKHYRVIAFDLPGSGYSDYPDVEYSIDLYSKYVASFITTYIKEPVIIGGGSMGGNLALKVSREYPELIRKTIAWSPAGVWAGNDVLSWLARHLMDGILYKPILYGQSLFWFPKVEDCMDAYDVITPYINEIDSPIFRRAAAALAADQLDSDHSHIGKGHLNLQPTLIVVGELDDGFDLANYAIKFAKELPNAKLVVMKKIGHSIHSENPEGLMEHIRQFVR